MRLPDGSVLMHAGQPYDPRKAHEYYLKTRKLKGRKPGAGVEAVKPGKSSPIKTANATVAKKAALDAFLNGLPFVQEGGSPEEAGKLLKSFKGKSDKEVQALASKYEKDHNLMSGALDSTVKIVVDKRNAARGARENQRVAKVEKGKQVVEAQQLKVKQAAAAKQVSNLREKLADLNADLKKAMAEARATEAKAKRGPTAADKAESARDSAKYRDKHKTELATKSKQAAKKKAAAPKDDPVAAIQKRIDSVNTALATAVAKQKALASPKKTG